MEQAPTRSPAVTAAGLLIVGALVAVDPSGLWPFGPLRWTVISTMGAITGGLVAWASPGRQRWTSASLAWAGLLGWLLLAALVADDRWSALVGHPLRHAGWWMWALGAALFWAGRRLDASPATISRWATAGAALLGIYCAWEWSAGPPIATATRTARLQGPFGSAAQLGAACALLLPIAWVAWRRETGWWRWLVAAPAIAGCSVALVGSGSRAAWMVIAVSGVVLAVTRRVSWRVAALIGGVLLIAALALLPRLDDVSQRTSGATSRLDEWRVATRVIAEHPLLGVGPDNYRLAVPEGIDAAYERRFPRERILPDRAHSAPLDVALAGGLPALVLWLALIAAVSRRVWRAAAGATAGIAVGVLAYGIGQLLLFPLAELDPLWWLLAGIVAADPVRRRSRTAIAAAALAGTVGVASLVAGTLDVAAGRLARTALRRANAGQVEATRDAAGRAVDLRPDSVSVRVAAAQAYIRLGTIADLDRAVAECDAALRWTPSDPIAADLRAVALLAKGDATGLEDDRQRAVAAWTALVRRDPLRARWQRQLGIAAAHANDTALAEQALRAAVELGDREAEVLLEQLFRS